MMSLRSLPFVLSGFIATQAGAFAQSEGVFLLAATTRLSVGESPTEIALGHVVKESVAPQTADAVTVSARLNLLQVWQGDGKGSFTRNNSLNRTVGNGPVAVELADLNGDGHLDAVVANAAGNSISVLLGDSTGAFKVQPEVRVLARPRAVAVADVDGDKLLDVLCVHSAVDRLSVLRGDGKGGLTVPAAAIAVGGRPVAVVTGDFNGDGRIDAVTANSAHAAGSVSLLLGDGRGGFARRDYATGRVPWTLSSGTGTRIPRRTLRW